MCWGRVDTEKAQRELYNLASGAAQPNMSATQIGSIKVTLPTRDILQKYNEISTSILDEILNLQKHNQNLKKSRGLLIPQLVGGRLEINE